MKVKLIRQVTTELPLGSIGKPVTADPQTRGLFLVNWDKNDWIIPMYQHEVEWVEDEP